MASKQAVERVENLDENLSFSSEDEGGEYDVASYGSDLQPPECSDRFYCPFSVCNIRFGA